MAATGQMSAPLSRAAREAQARRQVGLVRAAAVLIAATLWEAIARSGLVYQDVTPSLIAIGRAIFLLLGNPVFWANLMVTGWETLCALAIGAFTGVVFGVVIGANRFLAAAYEPFIHYLSPTPRIILFPVMIMWFGIGIASKIALGALSSFFAVALSTAAGMRQIDKVLIRVGRSFRATPLQMAMKIYLPAMRQPVLTGLRLGFGSALITVLLAETKLSNQGIGYMIMQIYTRFDMAALYGLLILVFAMAGAGNALIGRLAGKSNSNARG